MSSWFGVDLPGRSGGGTYGEWPASTLPSLSHVPNPYAHLKTVEDLRRFGAARLPNNSPTACYFALDRPREAFFYDQQGCIVWRLDAKTGEVYVKQEEEEEEEEKEEEEEEGKEKEEEEKSNNNNNNNNRVVVSPNLAEFLLRIKIENDLWFALNMPGEDGGEMTVEMQEYLDHYKRLEAGTREALMKRHKFQNLDSWFSRCGLIFLSFFLSFSKTNTRVYALRSGSNFSENLSYSFEAIQALDLLGPNVDFGWSLFGGNGISNKRLLDQLAFIVQESSKAAREAIMTWALIAKSRISEKNVTRMISDILWANRVADYGPKYATQAESKSPEKKKSKN